jgi:hypothetical protein
MEALSMFLVGGPAYSGTTLLTVMLNQGNVVCLDEPNFHKVEQRHRNIPYLQKRFPDVRFPPPPEGSITFEEFFDLFGACAAALEPRVLGMKTCDWQLVILAKLFKAAGHPRVVIFRDLRDTLVRRLPHEPTDEKMIERYRHVWEHRHLFDAVIRYEALIADPATVMSEVARALSLELDVRTMWGPKEVPGHMMKSERHHALKDGAMRGDRVGIWRTSGKEFSAEVHETARMMGYPD